MGAAKLDPSGDYDVTDMPHGGLVHPPSTTPTGTAGWTSVDVGKWLDKNGLGAHKKALVLLCTLWDSTSAYCHVFVVGMLVL